MNRFEAGRIVAGMVVEYVNDKGEILDEKLCVERLIHYRPSKVRVIEMQQFKPSDYPLIVTTSKFVGSLTASYRRFIFDTSRRVMKGVS